jgi:hypothetical protein
MLWMCRAFSTLACLLCRMVCSAVARVLRAAFGPVSRATIVGKH